MAAFASGFGQYGAAAALGDVAKSFGHVTHGASVADQAGLSGTILGLGLAVIRLASLGGLPLSGLADRWGRRKTVLATAALGLAFTVLAAASPGYWWFVVLFALGRPLLSATNAISQVTAAEQTASADRAKAVAFVAAAYALGAGLTAFIHSLAESALGFRGIFALSIVPLVFLALVARWITEPDRFAIASTARDHPMPILGPVSRAFRGRLVTMSLLAFAVSVITGPANTFVFIYAQNVLKMAGGLTAAMVVLAGALGLGGLLVGRWMADNLGRRPTCAIAVVGIAAAGTFAYSGTKGALVTGYVLGVLSGAVFAPGYGALLNELFPTAVRASAAGWQIAAGVVGAAVGLVVFGAVADAGAWRTAALATFMPMIAATALFLLVPETKGRELEDLWPAEE